MPIRELRTVSLRIKAGEMLLNGRDVTQVAQELGLCETSVRKYRAIVEHEGIAALQTLPLGGRRSALDANARATIREAFTRVPRDYAIDRERWTIGAVAQLIQREFGLTFSQVYVRQLIIDLGFGDRLRPVQPSSMPGKPPKLDTEGFDWLVTVLKQSPRVCGIEADHWTNALLRLAIEARYGVKYSRSHMWKIIADRSLTSLVRRT